MTSSRPAQRAYLIKFFQCKRADLSYIPRINTSKTKPCMVAGAVWVLRALVCQSNGLSESQAGEKPCLKNKMEGTKGKPPEVILWSPHAHKHMYVSFYTHVHTHELIILAHRNM